MGQALAAVGRTLPPLDSAPPSYLRILNNTERDGACWRFAGAKDRDGYGRSGNTRTHRVVYEALVGPIPTGLTIDHLCRVRDCVNPAHLEAVSRGENVLRGNSLAAQRARWVTCQRGHELTKDKRGQRRCAICESDRRKVARGYSGPPQECRKGHPFDETNTYMWRDNLNRVHRKCRTCMRTGAALAAAHRYRA